MVALKSAREKAKIAKSLNFAAQVHHALGAYAVGIWDFDDQANPTSDASGNGNDGTINGATWTAEGDTPSGKGYALSFDGDDYVNCGKKENLNITQELTISAWIKYTGIGMAWPGVLARRVANVSGYSIRISQSNLKPYFQTSGIDGEGFYSWESAIQLNVWQHIAVTYNVSSEKVITYLNGSIDHIFDRKFNITGGSNTFYIGTYAAAWFFNGTIDEVRIYSETLTSAQIKKLYVEGAEKRGLGVKE